MSWAARRRLLIIFILLVLAGAFFYVHYVPKLLVAPTCSDGVQNGTETGVDCGGSMCSTMCTADVAVPSILWARSFAVTENVYNAAAYIENKNAGATKAMTYEFRLYDDKGILVARRQGSTIIPPLGRYAIVETGIPSGSAQIARTTFAFSSTPAKWERLPEAQSALRVSTSNIALDTTGTAPKLSAAISNPSPTVTLSNTVVAAVLYDADDNAITVSRTIIPKLAPQEKTSVAFTWPRVLPNPVVRYEILPIVDVFSAR